MNIEPKDRIIFPLDVNDADEAIALVKKLNPYVGTFKIGLEFINSMLASVIASSEKEAAENLAKIRTLFRLLDGKIFWDGKFDDIPNTVAGASASVVKIGVKMFNVHASAGKESVKKAVQNKGSALVLGVTVLTSIDEKECESIFGDKPGSKVVIFARMLKEAGADGIICSPQELQYLAEHKEFDDLLKITPGVRPEWAASGDQKRVMTPYDAILFGATGLVIGRPIRQPPENVGDSVRAALKIQEEIRNAEQKINSMRKNVKRCRE
ncbi:MAG: orotidine-5'-phosphate decarboxylase [Candidatus Paceibacterota bacterium]|jgi:orotidine-5'-phosphate decarboxylase